MKAWTTHDGPRKWSATGRVTDMGHAEYAHGGVDRRDTVSCPFADPEDVLAFDAVAEYGLDDEEELVRHYSERWQRRRDSLPNQLVPGGRYKTLISGAIESFGWEMLLTAAAWPDRFERVLDSFHRLSLHHVRAWARTPIEAFICHDDMVWSSGPFMDPGFYRRAVFPRYAELWRVLHEAGKKVLYCSDGDWSLFLDDVAAAGADGFIFEPVVPFGDVVARFGGTHVIVGSGVDCRTLTFGSEDDILREVDSTIELVAGRPGIVLAVGNHIPANIPERNALLYIDHLRRNWSHA